MKRTSLIVTTLFFVLALGLAVSAHAQSSRRTGKGTPLPSSTQSTNEERLLPAGWRLYRFGEMEAAWGVAFPSEPGEKTGQVKLADDLVLTSHAYDAQTRSGSYGVMYMDGLPLVAGQLTYEKRESIYESLWKQATEGIQQALKESGLKEVVVTPEAQRKVVVSGHEGRERDFLISPARGRVRIVLAGRRAYVLTVFWTRQGFEEEHEAFFNSLEIRGKQ